MGEPRVWLAIIVMAVVNGAIPFIVHVVGWAIIAYVAWCVASGFATGYLAEGRWGR